jgi:hypothetical protein
MAFCAALLMSSMNTRSITESCASSLRPVTRIAMIIKRYTAAELTMIFRYSLSNSIGGLRAKV